MSEDATDKREHVVITADDVTDSRLVAGQLRALQREVHSGFELITTKLLTAFERVEQKLDDLSYRVSQLERSHDDMQRRVSVLETKRQRPRK